MARTCLSSMVALFALTVPLAVSGQDATADACEQVLGADYDRQPVHARQVRITRYAACRKRVAEAIVDRNYGDITREVNVFVANARQLINAQIGEKAASELKLLHSRQGSERAELQKRYEDELQAILAQATDRAETNAKRAEWLRRSREESAALLSRHTADVEELQAQIKNAYAAADAHIDDLAHDDRQSLAEQHRQKQEYLQAQFESLASGRIDQSLEDYEAAHGIEPPEPGVLWTLFIYVSGLVGKKGPSDDQPIDMPVGEIGIRG